MPAWSLARRDLLVESRKHSATKLLRQIPSIGPIRAGLLIALIQTPYRFRTKRQLWAYSGLALETHDSAEYRYLGGQLQRSKKQVTVYGLNENHNHDIKNIFKSAATPASSRADCTKDFENSTQTGSAQKGQEDRSIRRQRARPYPRTFFPHPETGTRI